MPRPSSLQAIGQESVSAQATIRPSWKPPVLKNDRVVWLSRKDLKVTLTFLDTNLHHFFERIAALVPNAVCVVSHPKDWTYAEVEKEANRIAKRLISTFQIRRCDRVAVLLPPGLDAYLAILSILKCGATYVPIDPSLSVDLIEMICLDADVRLTIGQSEIVNLRHDLQRDSEQPMRYVDSADLAYILYISKNSGGPKRVGISHGNICNFLEAVPALYEIGSLDRVYQGMTASFDSSLEKVWPTFAAAAALVPYPSLGSRLVGNDLFLFLCDQRVSVLNCVSKLLTTIEGELPNLHMITVGGEVCPQDLVRRWNRPDRRTLNRYEPRKPTITASQPVTIGKAQMGHISSLLRKK
jgi:non-ribosomal peptide synthetase component F